MTKYNEKTKEFPIRKVYAFGLFLNNKNLEVVQLTADEVLKSYTIDSETGKKIEPDKKTIYCGIEKDDIICGFNLI